MVPMYDKRKSPRLSMAYHSLLVFLCCILIGAVVDLTIHLPPMASPSTSQIPIISSSLPNKRPQYASISTLSYDAIFEMCQFMDANDIICLLSTCRALRAHYFEDSLWSQLCKRFGVLNTTSFGGRSFRVIYTALLHVYGPLIGLWAGNHPFTGNILEFTLEHGSEMRRGGILGQMWLFRPVQPEDADYEALQMPEQPTYRRVIKIGFDTDADDSHVRILCYGTFHSAVPGVMSEMWHRGTLKVMSKTEQSMFVHTRLGPFAHPDFPGKRFIFPSLPNAAADDWHDKTCPFPRLREEIQKAVDQSFLTTRVANPRIPIILATRVSYTSPRAIAIDCDNHCMQLNAPFLGFENLIPSQPRYYPIRADIIAGIDPMSANWSARSLEGLWLGALGSHGTECIYLSWHQISSRITGCKVTGDENVPRGALSWSMLTTAPYVVEEHQRQLLEQSFGSLDRCRLFHGEAITSERGYM